MPAVKRVVTTRLPTHYGAFLAIGYEATEGGEAPMAFVMGAPDTQEAPLVRIHSSCFTGDVLASLRCDCGDQLHLAMRMIEGEGHGVIVYLPQEGRGIGLLEKLKAYNLQDKGFDTVEANLALGHSIDARDYAIGIAILHDLGITRLRLLTNNPRKLAVFQDEGTESGIEVVERMTLVGPPRPEVENYLRAKRDKLGHRLPDETPTPSPDLEPTPSPISGSPISGSPISGKTEKPEARPPLAGLRVLDLTRILAGPTCTQLLGDLGADIIKIERAEVGDDTRKWGPPYVMDIAGEETDESAYYLSANRNKRSVAIDLGKPDGAALVRRLAVGADVLIENFKVGGLVKYGLAYETLSTDIPRLVYCSITGFGQWGPYAHRPGYDILAQAMGGIMSITGEPDGPPVRVGVGISDIMCGMYAATAILAALRHRDATGQGQHIDISLLDTQVAWLINEGLNYLTSGVVPKRRGTAHPNIVPYQLFEASDGPVIIAIGNDAQFRRFCGLEGLDALAEDPRFATNAARVCNRDALIPIVAEAVGERTRADILADLDAIGVPASPVNDIAEVFADPQVGAREMRITMAHPLAASGSVDLIGNPLKLSQSPVAYRRSPPLLGEHTDEVLEEILGLDSSERRRLRKAGVIGGDGPAPAPGDKNAHPPVGKAGSQRR